MLTTDSAESWAGQINHAIGQTVQSIITVGRLLIAAKGALPFGEFRRIFDGGLVPIKKSAAAELMAIALHPVITDVQHAGHLPSSWTILGQLARIPAAELQHAITTSRITPSMTRRQAKALRIASERPPIVRPPEQPRGVSKTKDATAARLDAIREHVADGATSDQIAEYVGMTVPGVRATMKRAGIVCHADKVVGRQRKIDPNRVIDHIVLTSEEYSRDERLIDFTRLDPARIDEWIDALVAAQRGIAKLITRLRQRRESLYGASQTHTSHVEDPARPDQPHGRAARADLTKAIH